MRDGCSAPHWLQECSEGRHPLAFPATAEGEAPSLGAAFSAPQKLLARARTARPSRAHWRALLAFEVRGRCEQGNFASRRKTGEVDAMNTVKRVQLDLPERSMVRLQELRSKTEATSYAEVVKNALRLYEAVVEETEAGNKFLVQSSDGKMTEYKIF